MQVALTLAAVAAFMVGLVAAFGIGAFCMAAMIEARLAARLHGLEILARGTFRGVEDANALILTLHPLEDDSCGQRRERHH